MNKTRIVIVFLCVVALIVWVINGYTFFSLFYSHNTKTAVLKNPREVFLMQASDLTDSALQLKADRRSFHFSAMTPPFKPITEADPPTAHRVAIAPQSQVKLLLKGVLLKARPLAIFEDSAGKTYICGVGDTVCTQAIQNIEATRVTLKNSLGSYSLSVKD